MPQDTRPSMLQAIAAQQAENQAKADAAAAPARQQYADAIAADAALFGTPAWQDLSEQRKAVIAAHTRKAAQATAEGAQQ